MLKYMTLGVHTKRNPVTIFQSVADACRHKFLLSADMFLQRLQGASQQQLVSHTLYFVLRNLTIMGWYGNVKWIHSYISIGGRCRHALEACAKHAYVFGYASNFLVLHIITL